MRSTVTLDGGAGTSDDPTLRIFVDTGANTAQTLTAAALAAGRIEISGSGDNYTRWAIDYIQVPCNAA